MQPRGDSRPERQGERDQRVPPPATPPATKRGREEPTDEQQPAAPPVPDSVAMPQADGDP